MIYYRAQPNTVSRDQWDAKCQEAAQSSPVHPQPPPRWPAKRGTVRLTRKGGGVCFGSMSATHLLICITTTGWNSRFVVSTRTTAQLVMVRSNESSASRPNEGMRWSRAGERRRAATGRRDVRTTAGTVLGPDLTHRADVIIYVSVMTAAETRK